MFVHILNIVYSNFTTMVSAATKTGAIAEYSPHPLVLQKTTLTQTKTLTLMSVNKTWTQV